MTRAFDRRVVPSPVVALLQAVDRVAPAHLGGGAALSGVHLSHRLSGDVDLFVHDREAHRRLAAELPRLAASAGASFELQLDAGTMVRGTLRWPERSLLVDAIHEPAADLASAEIVEGVACESMLDLRASKITCLLSRSEPRDLVDVMFLERAGFRPEDDLALALQKDAGIDPAILAWLLSRFPLSPLPVMLQPIEAGALLRYRDDLADRLRKLARP